MKKYFSLFALLLAAILFTAGGLFLPKFLLDKQQDSLFRKTETTILPTMTDTSTDRTFQKFTPEKLLQVASCYQNYNMDYWLTYTPREGQMTTEEVLQISHEQIEQLCGLNVLPEQFSDENYTYEGVEHGIPCSPEDVENMMSNTISPDYDYSGWIILSGNNYLSITAYINSVSGQVLGLSASWYSPDNLPVSELLVLKQFLQYLGLDQEPAVCTREPGYASCTFDNYAYSLNVSLENFPEEHEIINGTLSENTNDMLIRHNLFISIINTDPEASSEIRFDSP